MPGGQSFFAIQPGEEVEISHGVFAGYEGIFEERLKGDERVRVLLKMLSDRYVPVEIIQRHGRRFLDELLNE